MATYLALYISTRNYNYTYITKVYGGLKSHQQRCKKDLLEKKQKLDKIDVRLKRKA